MFPASLATGPFSLRAGCDCCAVSVGARLNADGSLASDVVVAPSALRPAQRMSYDEADAALAAGTDADLAALAEARVPRDPTSQCVAPAARSRSVCSIATSGGASVAAVMCWRQPVPVCAANVARACYTQGSCRSGNATRDR